MSAQIKLIGLSGLSGSGKSTVAKQVQYLYWYAGNRPVQLGFAEPFKEFGHLVFEFPTDSLWGPSHRRAIPEAAYATEHAWTAAQRRFDASFEGWAASVLADGKASTRVQEAKKFARAWFESVARPREDWSARAFCISFGEKMREFDPCIWVNYVERQVLAQARDGRAVVISDVGRGFPLEINMIRRNAGVLWEIRGRGQITGPREADMGLEPDEVIDNSGSETGTYNQVRRLLDSYR